MKTKLSKSDWNSFYLGQYSAKKADHILEMPGIGVFYNYYLKNFTSKIRLAKKCSKFYQK